MSEGTETTADLARLGLAECATCGTVCKPVRWDPPVCSWCDYLAKQRGAQ